MVNLDLRLASRARQYITRGHASIGLAVSVINTCVLWFGLVPFVNATFVKFRFFLMAFVPSYLCFTLAFGYWDMKKGTYKHEQAAAAQWSPVYQDMFYCFKKMGERLGDEDICSVASKWTARRETAADKA